MPWIRSKTFHIRSKSVVRMSALLSRSWSNRCPDRCLVTIGVLRGRMGVVTHPPPCLLRTAFVARKSPVNALGNGLDYGQTINRTMTRHTPPHAAKKRASPLPALAGKFTNLLEKPDSHIHTTRFSLGKTTLRAEYQPSAKAAGQKKAYPAAPLAVNLQALAELVAHQVLANKA